MTAIDRITVISLDSTPDRFAKFTEVNAHLPIERFPAVDGQLIDRWDFVDEGLFTAGNPYTLSGIACAVSHIRLWQACRDERRAIHVAEDDAIFRRDFLPMASAMLSSLDAWDIVLWGWNFDWPLTVALGDGLGPAMVTCDETSLRAEWTRFQTATTQPLMLRLLSNAGTCAYSISPAGARGLLERCLPIAGKHAAYPGRPDASMLNQTLDIEMTRHYAALRSFVAFPGLAVTLNDKSESTFLRA